MLAHFLSNLLREGEVSFDAPPESPAPDTTQAAAILQDAFLEYRLEVAGPLIEFDSAAALDAAEYVRWACWFLVHRDSPEEEVRKRLAAPKAGERPDQHLSVDLVFRFLPQLHRRSRAISPDDILTQSLVEAMRAFPLSGVLADLDEPPTASLDFADHEGLQLMYAERFISHVRESWRPNGRVAELIELLNR